MTAKPDQITAKDIAPIDDDIDDSRYTSELPGILGVADAAIARIEAVLLAAGVC